MLGLGLAIPIERSYTPAWVLPGATVDMNFATSSYFGGSLASLISCTRAQTVSSYATTASGLLVPFAANTPRITSLGLLVEQGSTNTALHSRDMTQASWVAVNMTAALNAVGADGTANSATTLTATAGNATILQPLTIGSTTETYSVYLKRVSGTGTINISENGGSSWTACTINSTSFTLCSVEATLANPSVGIQIVTNGDVIVADFNQNEALAFATSPIPTTTTSVARSADNVKAIGNLFSTLAGPAGWAVVSMPSSVGGGILQRRISPNDSLLNLRSTTQLQVIVSSSGVAVSNFGSGTISAPFTVGATFDSTGVASAANGGAVASSASAFSGAPTAGNTIIGSSDGSSSGFVNSYISRISIGNKRLSNAQLQALVP